MTSWVTYLTVVGGVVLAGVLAVNAPAGNHTFIGEIEEVDTASVGRAEHLLAELDAVGEAGRERLENVQLKRSPMALADPASQRWSQLRRQAAKAAGTPKARPQKSQPSRATSASRSSGSNAPRGKGVFARSRFAQARGNLTRDDLRTRKHLPTNYKGVERPGKLYVHKSDHKSIFERSRKYRESGSSYPMKKVNRRIRR